MVLPNQSQSQGGPYGYTYHSYVINFKVWTIRLYIYHSYYNIVIILVSFPFNIDDRFRLPVVLLGTQRTNAHTHEGPHGYIQNSHYNIIIILVGFPINIDDRIIFYEPNSSCFTWYQKKKCTDPCGNNYQPQNNSHSLNFQQDNHT